jgi:hypothetical protein
MRAVEGGFRTTLPRGELSEDEHVEIDGGHTIPSFSAEGIGNFLAQFLRVHSARR